MYPHVGFGFGYPGLGLLLVILFGALIVIGIMLLARRPTTPVATAPADQRSQAQRILEERYARGEIDEVEFRARLEVLLGVAWASGTSAGTPTSGPGWTTPLAPPAPPPAPPAGRSTPPTSQPDRPASTGALADEGSDQ